MVVVQFTRASGDPQGAMRGADGVEVFASAQDFLRGGAIFRLRLLFGEALLLRSIVLNSSPGAS
jgi:hypothetical protein